MTHDTRPYLTMQHMQSIAPDLMGFMQKQALDRINSVIDDIYDRASSLALRSLYFRLRETEHLQQSEIVKLFALLEPTIEFDIDQRLSKGMIATVLNDILHFQNGAIVLDYILPVIEQHKTAIVTYLLTYIKNKGVTPDMRGFVDALSDLNLNWPEIHIMNKSVQSLNENALTVDPKLANSVIAKFQGKTNLGPLITSLFTYKNMGGDMSAIDAQAKETIMPLLQAPINAKNLHKIFDYVQRFSILFNWPELRDIKISTISRMIRALEKYKQQPGHIDTASYAAHVIYMMRQPPNVLEEAKPQLVDTINKMKTPIMVDLLTLYKHGNVGPATSCIYDLRSIGIDWPEFAAIDKSVAAGRKPKPIAEAASLDTLLTYADKNISQLVDGNVETFYRFVLGLEKQAKGKTDAETNALTTQVLFKHKAAIVAHVNSLVNGKTPEQNINGLFAIQLLKRLSINWPEIRQFVTTRAVDIVKHGLTNYGLTTGLDIMKTVEALGIPKRDIEDAIRTVGKKLLDEINKMVDENAVQVAIENRFRLFKRFGIVYKMKAGPLKTKMLNSLDNVLSQQGLTPSSVGLINLITNYSADIAITMQEIAALMQKHKTPVVKRLLQDFKNDNTYNLSDYLKTLKQLKLDWPEIDIIIKSTRFGLNESLDAITANNAMTVLFRILRVNWQAPKVWERKAYEQFIEDHKQQILDHFRHQAETVWQQDNDMSISTDIFMAMGLQFNGKDWPELKEIFEQNREQIIRQLLKTVKFHQGVNLYAKDILMTLLAMGFKWPELEVLQRSMNASQRRGIGNE
jgi:hypothetical protein